MLDVREIRVGELFEFETETERQAAMSEVRRKIDLLQEEIQAITHQLGQKNKTDEDGRRLSIVEWEEWRQRALAAMRVKQRQANDLKDELRRLTHIKPRQPHKPHDVGFRADEFSDDDLRFEIEVTGRMIGNLKKQIEHQKKCLFALKEEARHRRFSDYV